MHSVILVGLPQDFATALTKEGFHVAQVDGYFKLRKLLENGSYSCVIAERTLPLEGVEKKVIDGLQFAIWAERVSPWTKIILLDRGWTKNLVRDTSKVGALVADLTNLSILKYPSSPESQKKAFRHLQKELGSVEVSLFPRVGEIVTVSESGEVGAHNSYDPEFREDLIDFLTHKANNISQILQCGPWLECRWQGAKTAEIIKRRKRSLLAIAGEREPPTWSQDIKNTCLEKYGKRLQ